MSTATTRRPAGSLRAVYDAYDATWLSLTDRERDQLRAWAIEQGIDPERTYRWEIHIIDMPLVRVFAYDTDEGGRLRIGATGDLVRHSPYELPLVCMPPVPPASPKEGRLR